MNDKPKKETEDLEEIAARQRYGNPALAEWAAGYGVIKHSAETQVWIHEMAERLGADAVTGDGVPLFEVLSAADRLASAAMWLVVHQTYASRVFLDGRELRALEFKASPEGHTGGALNMVPAYVGWQSTR